MINHLVNDIAVMGAKPLAVLDTIVCGNAEKETIKLLSKAFQKVVKKMNVFWLEVKLQYSHKLLKKGFIFLLRVSQELFQG